MERTGALWSWTHTSHSRKLPEFRGSRRILVSRRSLLVGRLGSAEELRTTVRRSDPTCRIRVTDEQIILALRQGEGSATPVGVCRKLDIDEGTLNRCAKQFVGLGAGGSLASAGRRIRSSSSGSISEAARVRS